MQSVQGLFGSQGLGLAEPSATSQESEPALYMGSGVLSLQSLEGALQKSQEWKQEVIASSNRQNS